ncbi:DUF4870 domain-containing protein [Thermomonas brevis]|uniref:DUF4870 domain-containing protein n=1 Tax=Thermomonas brevis TaxID=215691 RepID=A0A7G9QRW6_9GAMM|nr:DUF4870 domain-containing protein [Thermomonas brevis]QNN46091.1 DUF4870 domain-containing protein [Thermomonas brevis]
MDTVQMQTLTSSQNDRLWAASAHGGALLLAFLTSWSAGIAGMLAAGAIYLAKKDDSGFVAEHAREAFNFNLSMFLMACALAIVGAVLVGATILTLGIGAIVTLPAGLVLAVMAAVVAVSWLVCSIVATFKAWNGESYRYPFTLRLLK